MSLTPFEKSEVKVVEYRYMKHTNSKIELCDFLS